MKTFKRILFSILHVAAAFAIMLIAQLLGVVVSSLFSVNAIIDDLTYSAVYVCISLLLGYIYSKYIRMDFSVIGISKNPPRLRWLVIALILPLSITAFYLLFTEGIFVKTDYTTFLPTLFNALIPVGLVAGFCEEFIFRGLMLRGLEKLLNKTVAILAPSILFAAIHVIMIIDSVTVTDIILLLVSGTEVGIMFSLIAIASGTVWASAIVHALWNAIIIGGVFVIEAPQYGTMASSFYCYELLSDSLLLTGGAFGIESALPAIIGYLLVSIIVLFSMKKNRNAFMQPRANL
ncbi:MAG TPA: CPBP family intramembrane metalloprotease [Candidatus Ornithomonoglobus intestinigallinarum]|uniref:CPBP family intramembrane metalloprotease n=1 Tax=Candidatus Ornithomonoglobus intestinigallinarum TaxID=2840894 RepID=A0A9D1H4D2_9FIRM|nr:CPBP family intramembrane metalloprotease [Candidatus Ornithomonoglobus intestinigallinarum]